MNYLDKRKGSRPPKVLCCRESEENNCDLRAPLSITVFLLAAKTVCHKKRSQS